MGRRCFVHGQTLYADIVVVVTNTRANLNCIPCAFGDRTFDALTIRLFVEKARIEIGQTFDPIPETTALETDLTTHSLIIGNGPTERRLRLIKLGRTENDQIQIGTLTFSNWCKRNAIFVRKKIANVRPMVTVRRLNAHHTLADRLPMYHCKLSPVAW